MQTDLFPDLGKMSLSKSPCHKMIIDIHFEALLIYCTNAEPSSLYSLDWPCAYVLCLLYSLDYPLAFTDLLNMISAFYIDTKFGLQKFNSTVLCIFPL